MKKILLSAFALAAMTSVAMAEPVKMTDTQMDAVTAGGVAYAQAHAVAIGAFNTSVATAVAINIENSNFWLVKPHKKDDHKKMRHHRDHGKKDHGKKDHGKKKKV